jgi:hypothetical protein
VKSRYSIVLLILAGGCAAKPQYSDLSPAPVGPAASFDHAKIERDVNLRRALLWDYHLEAGKVAKLRMLQRHSMSRTNKTTTVRH